MTDLIVRDSDGKSFWALLDGYSSSTAGNCGKKGSMEHYIVEDQGTTPLHLDATRRRAPGWPGGEDDVSDASSCRANDGRCRLVVGDVAGLRMAA